MKPPSALKPDGGEHACFIPKKCTKKLAGHTKGVQAIEFFPNTGHLLLSASMDRCSAMVASVMYVCMYDSCVLIHVLNEYFGARHVENWSIHVKCMYIHVRMCCVYEC